MDNRVDYRGFKYWLVETTIKRKQIWRIQLPNGEKTAPTEYAREVAVISTIDALIASAEGPPLGTAS